jgi:hypothetical protein
VPPPPRLPQSSASCHMHIASGIAQQSTRLLIVAILLLPLAVVIVDGTASGVLFDAFPAVEAVEVQAPQIIEAHVLGGDLWPRMYGPGIRWMDGIHRSPRQMSLVVTCGPGRIDQALHS